MPPTWRRGRRHGCPLVSLGKRTLVGVVERLSHLLLLLLSGRSFIFLVRSPSLPFCNNRRPCDSHVMAGGPPRPPSTAARYRASTAMERKSTSAGSLQRKLSPLIKNASIYKNYSLELEIQGLCFISALVMSSSICSPAPLFVGSQTRTCKRSPVACVFPRPGKNSSREIAEKFTGAGKSFTVTVSDHPSTPLHPQRIII